MDTKKVRADKLKVGDVIEVWDRHWKVRAWDHRVVRHGGDHYVLLKAEGVDDQTVQTWRLDPDTMVGKVER